MTTNEQEQQYLQQLKQIFDNTAPLLEAVGSPERLRVAPKSDLALDDEQSRPFHVSHAAILALGVAVDHLNSMRLLISGCETCEPHGMIFPVYAHWALVRGAFENGCRSVWLLGPNERSTRIIRSLRVHATNIEMSNLAATVVGSSNIRPKVERLTRLKSVAERAGLSAGQAKKKYQMLDVVQYAGEQALGSKDAAEVVWRGSSGAMHGDLWATMSLQSNTLIFSSDPTVASAESTVNIAMLAQFSRYAFSVISAGLRLFEERSR